MLAKNKDTTFVPLLSALLRGGEPFWNPTVNKVLNTAKECATFLGARELSYTESSRLVTQIN